MKSLDNAGFTLDLNDDVMSKKQSEDDDDREAQEKNHEAPERGEENIKGEKG